ncbi:DUF1684 domain-containing protein [Aquamicrobium sp. LC103]|uniref:DUF1684 domain-containing protein n=1 Tax=Aquamicrobium sp. LC103 TaxID=1120658 RepID=UPI00069BD2D3|nr:DUF1684 domain-containing protein [Aquamicrobium sp. LC103]TKT76351.1 DUF1684 domain-containing protein [Aquamicrobium sp. LC103]
MTNFDYENSIERWRADRIARLTAEEGWLNIIGRWELEPGTVRLGSADDNDIVLSVGPDHVGTLAQDEDGGVTFTPASGGEPIRLALDKKKPPRFSVDRLLLEVTTLNGRNALRVRDKESPARRSFPGIEHFPVVPDWRIVAEWSPLAEPITMTVDTIVGIPTDVTITHKAAFTHDGVRYELLPTHGTAEAPQFVLRDLTSRSETYPASRFLFGEDIGKDTIVLDFNKAINPPCAFTDFAVCPLPPPENVLPFRVEAGELKFKG